MALRCDTPGQFTCKRAGKTCQDDSPGQRRLVGHLAQRAGFAWGRPSHASPAKSCSEWLHMKHADRLLCPAPALHTKRCSLEAQAAVCSLSEHAGMPLCCAWLLTAAECKQVSPKQRCQCDSLCLQRTGGTAGSEPVGHFGRLHTCLSGHKGACDLRLQAVGEMLFAQARLQAKLHSSCCVRHLQKGSPCAWSAPAAHWRVKAPYVICIPGS